MAKLFAVRSVVSRFSGQVQPAIHFFGGTDHVHQTFEAYDRDHGAIMRLLSSLCFLLSQHLFFFSSPRVLCAALSLSTPTSACV